MKRIRIAVTAVLLALALVLMGGCGKPAEKDQSVIKLEDVQADPAKYVAEGTKLTFGNTIIKAFLEPTEQMSLKVSSKSEEFEGGGVIYVDSKNMKTAAILDMVTSSTTTDEEGSMMMAPFENFSIGVYVTENNLVIDSELLGQFVGHDAIGVDFDMKAADIEASAIYELLTTIPGAEDLDVSFIDSITGSDGLEKLVNAYLDTFKSTIENELVKIEVTEETVKIDDAEIKAIVVTQTIDEKVYEKLIKNTTTTLKSISGLIGEGSEEDVLGDIAEVLPKVNGKVKYYLSTVNGALIKVDGSGAVEVKYDEPAANEDGEEAEPVTKTDKIDASFNVSFGADPANGIVPNFNIDVKGGEFEFSAKGESQRKDGKLTVDGSVNYKHESEEEEGKQETENSTFTFVLEDSGAFSFKVKADKEENAIKGELKGDDKSISVKLDVSDIIPEKEDSEDENGDAFISTPTIDSVEFELSFGAKFPEIPEYTSILDLTSTDLAPLQSIIALLTGDFGDSWGDDEDGRPEGDPAMTFEDIVYEEVLWNLDIEEEELDEILSDYEEEGFASEYEYLCSLYIESSAADLVELYEIAEETVNEYIEGIVEEAADMAEAAKELYNSYFEFVSENTPDDWFDIDPEETIREELLWYLEVDEEGLEELLSGYEEEGFADEYEYMCSLYIEESIEYLTEYCEIAEEKVTEFVEGICEEALDIKAAAEELVEKSGEFIFENSF